MTLGGKWNVKTDLFFSEKKISEGIESSKQISKCTGIPLMTVYRVVKNIPAGKGIERQNGSGRPRKLNETSRRRLDSWSVSENGRT